MQHGGSILSVTLSVITSVEEVFESSEIKQFISMTKLDNNTRAEIRKAVETSTLMLAAVLTGYLEF